MGSNPTYPIYNGIARRGEKQKPYCLSVVFINKAIIRKAGNVMSKLLINENPLQVLPSLAVKTSLNEAIVLQQIHYWLEKSEHIHDGRKWVYNSIDNWCEQFPFFSKSTVDRTFKSLCDRGLLIKGNYNKSKFDKTNWYSIDYDRLGQLENDDDFIVNEPITSNWSNGEIQNEVDNTIDYNTENTNIDYDTDNISPTELNTNKFASSPTGLHTSLSDERKADTNSKDKWVVTKNHIVSVMDNLGYGELADETQSAIEIFRYYCMVYKQKTGKAHPRLNDKAMTDTLVNFIDSLSEIDCIDCDDYECMIDEHFSNNYGKEIDYSIRHFMNIGILKKLYKRLIY